MTLREYEVATGDPWGRTTTVQLSDEDAKARGLIPQAEAEPDGTDPAQTGEDSGDAGSGEKEAKAPANKAAPKAPVNKDSAQA
ncbi:MULTISPECIES: hypothetical protein [Mycobacteriaceae]|uniref:hypothetical protein n=1 Tax=Mycobacteriaceae TaxID=1762 RepID=UPI0009932791|nr:MULTISPECIES: hypothetical protein [Mycobacteriaceae]MDO3058483.1 hypothetical protein [Mycobacteroides abscessus subsp. abscessus]MDO3277981.1 hypothetical protein [Mycobacteroides abscessus subsp. abscessus]